ncbi:MAG: Txe/YoeB family addiction module toxin, partial [Methanosarcinaceae archaeon]|nr:Txe/YoeB family addiction module toxin [Methanosarcinaceae archaeon]
KIALSGLKNKAETLIEILRENPYCKQPSFKKLFGELPGAYSRRINIQHRLMNQIIDEKKLVKILGVCNQLKKLTV